MDCRVVMVRGVVGVPLDTLIMFGTGSKYVHCALWFERNGQQFIVEISAQSGLRRQPWNEYEFRGESDIYAVKGMTSAKAEEAYKWVMGPTGPFEKGTTYDYWQIAGIVALILDICIPRRFNPFDVSKNYICSELVQVALEWAGFIFKTPEGFSTPQSLLDEGMLKREIPIG